LLKFLDFVNGLIVVESGRTDDSNSQKVQITGTQHIQQ